MRRLLAAALTVSLFSAAVPAATADESPGYRALTINTPGQSGHVSAPEFALRTAGADPGFGPHTTDQLPLYTDFAYTDGMLHDGSGTPTTTLPGARIWRDEYGRPTVFGDDLASAWRGVGYALSEDRMWQQHLFRMAARGRLSELIGDDGLEMDIATRRDYYTAAEIDAYYASLSPREKTIVDAYAEGVNLYLAEMHANPSKMPAEIAALALPIEPWKPTDTMFLGALMARQIASDGGQELENAKLLTDLVAAHGETEGHKIFDDLLWLNDPGAPTSVPAREGRFPSYPHGAPAAAALGNSTDFANTLPESALSVAKLLRLERRLRSKLSDQLGVLRGGSNAWVVGPERSANGNAFLFGAPQVGYNVPGQLVEFEVAVTGGPDAMHAKGVTVAGVPTVGIGYTATHAWGLTSGLSDTTDLYVEKLTGPRSYEFKSETKAMDCRTEQFLVKDTTKMIEGTPPRVEEHELCRSVHGPVIEIDEAKGVAYAQRHAIWGTEVDTLRGLFAFPYATSLEEFTASVEQLTWNENIFYADADGNIAYWHPGRYPKRPRNFDERLPYPGTGEAEWEGFLTPAQMPHAINPKQGFLANWNSKPSVGWTSGDPHYGDRPWGQANRLHTLTDVLRKRSVTIGAWDVAGEDGLTRGTDGLFAPDVNGGTFDHTVDYFRPLLAQAAADPAASERARAAIALIQDWDGSQADSDGDGTVDHPGAAIFDQWILQAPKTYFGEYLTIGGFGRLSGHKWDPSPMINLFLRALLGDRAALPQSRDYLQGQSAQQAILTTLETQLDALAARHGGAPMQQWRRPADRVSLDVQGLGPGGDFPYQDRGSWIEAVEYHVR
jgi:penicillin amidase